MKAGRIVIGIVVLAIFAIAIFLGFAGREKGPSKNWRPSFSANSSRPFGSKLLFERLGDLFDADTLVQLPKGPFDTLAFKRFDRHLLMIIAASYQPEEFKVKELLRFVEEGNDVLLASNYFPGYLLDELGLQFQAYMKEDVDSLDVRLPGRGSSYRFSGRHTWTYFNNWSQKGTKPIAILDDDRDKAIALKVQHGRGSFLLSTHPFAFSNYYMVRKPEVHYVEEILTQLPRERRILWDAYYKPDRPASRGENPPPRSNNSSSLWAYIMQHEALRWAFYVLIAGSLVYVLLGGKRRQRLVPIIKPLRNSTLEFTETIGRLYLYEKNKKAIGEKHKLMADKKVRVFLEHIRSKYNLKTSHLDQEFEKNLAAKTEMENKEIRILLRRIRQVQEQEDVLADTLVQLNNEIENFYHRNGR